jgi:hypothetical protein
MPLDPTILDLDNLNPTIKSVTSTNKRNSLLILSLIVTTVIITAGVYFYKNNYIDNAQAN